MVSKEGRAERRSMNSNRSTPLYILRRYVIVKSLVLFILIFTVVYGLFQVIKIPESEISRDVINHWCQFKGIYENCFNEFQLDINILKQSLSLSIFLITITFIIVSMKLRFSAAIFGIAILVIMGVVPPQRLIYGVEWSLVMFLIGAMTLGHMLQVLGVFRYIAIGLLRLGGRSTSLFLFSLLIIPWFLAFAVDEVTSIVYSVTILLNIRKLVKFDIKPLIIIAVMATNIGSMSLPIGNPIGIYLSFSAKLYAYEFVFRALPLSLIQLLSLVFTSLLICRNYLNRVFRELYPLRIGIVAEEYYSGLDKRAKIRIFYGLAVLIGFIITVVLHHVLANFISSISGTEIDPHKLLVFIPYIFVFLTLEEYRPEKLEIALVRGVEWSTLIFIISLLMLDYSIKWTGVITRIAIYISMIHGSTLLIEEIVLFITYILSAFIDNLSVIVALSSVSASLVAVGYPKYIFWILLYGGIAGGNLTPIGSSANIVALEISERRGIKISWRDWFKVAFIPALVQIVISSTWITLLQ